MKRSSGLLMHITSLPTEYGIGDMGPAAYRFVDFLAQAKQSYWQMLPLNRTEEIFFNSPYSSVSAFAANPILISPELLVKSGLLSQEDLKPLTALPQDRVDYPQVITVKNKIFDLAYAQFKKQSKLAKPFQAFCAEKKGWLDDYALFMVIKAHFNGQIWNEWPAEIRDRDPKSLEELTKKYSDDIEKTKFLQFLFYQQWTALKDYANSKKILLIGDIPIYVSYDSVDVWCSPQLYKLNDDKSPQFVAGVPPDYFSQTGQRWGNPVYDWEKHTKEKYAWWMTRIQHNLSLFDCIRIDHFRGLVAYWEIPASEETAVNGSWVTVPHDDFISKIQKRFSKGAIIAEDLGLITPDVVEVMEKFGLPGMKVLHFAFNADMNTHPYLPHNYTENFIVYPGTHDNNTTQGWFKEDATDQEKDNLKNYVGKEFADSEVHWVLIDLAIKSKAVLSVFPVQDILGLGADARMNTPGTVDHNWEWRLGPQALNETLAKRLAKLTKEAGRV